MKPAQVTLQAVSTVLIDHPPAPTAGLVTLTLGHGVRGPDRDEALAAAATADFGGGGKSVGAKELPVLLGDLHDVLVDVEVDASAQVQ